MLTNICPFQSPTSKHLCPVNKILNIRYCVNIFISDIYMCFFLIRLDMSRVKENLFPTEHSVLIKVLQYTSCTCD